MLCLISGGYSFNCHSGEPGQFFCGSFPVIGHWTFYTANRACAFGTTPSFKMLYGHPLVADGSVYDLKKIIYQISFCVPYISKIMMYVRIPHAKKKDFTGFTDSKDSNPDRNFELMTSRTLFVSCPSWPRKIHPFFNSGSLQNMDLLILTIAPPSA